MSAAIAVEPIRSIVIIGRRWFDRVNGNTYHTTVSLVDGREVTRTKIAYGYGDQYVESACEAMEALGIIKRTKHANGSRQHLWRYCADNGIELRIECADVARKRDL